MFFQRFFKKYVFDNYDDYKENATPIVPENFNFAYDVVDARMRREGCQIPPPQKADPPHFPSG